MADTGLTPEDITKAAEEMRQVREADERAEITAKPNQIDVVLQDQHDTDDTLAVTVIATERGVEIRAAGHSDYHTEAPFGSPVYLELVDGVLMVRIWADINREDTTHSIPLDGALESKRIEEVRKDG